VSKTIQMISYDELMLKFDETGVPIEQRPTAFAKVIEQLISDVMAILVSRKGVIILEFNSYFGWQCRCGKRFSRLADLVKHSTLSPAHKFDGVIDEVRPQFMERGQ
jgi:hypothetical protein